MTYATSSIPRSTNTRQYSHLSSTSSSSSTSKTNNNHNHNNHNPPWNKSTNINKDGFLTKYYKRIQGDWEIESNHNNNNGDDDDNNTDNDNQYNYINLGKYTKIIKDVNDRVLIRQVPGDGNCLFHSITVSLGFICNSTHIDMVGSGSSSSSSSISSSSSSSKSSSSSSSSSIRIQHNHQYQHDIHHLYQHSQYLRQKAVDILSSNPRRLLFLQGNEYLRARDLVNAAAAQYNLSGEEYCDLMRKESYWGGGPEIVALCNYLKRPIHVYELCSISDNDDTTSSSTSSSENDDYERIEEDNIIMEGGNGNNNGNHKNLPHHKNDNDVEKNVILTNQQFQIRRMACFGSPKFDRKKPIHILSADSRFPDVEPGKQFSSGNHFMAVFPEDLIHSVSKEMKKLKRKRQSAGMRGGGTIDDFLHDSDDHKGRRNSSTSLKHRSRRRRRSVTTKNNDNSNGQFHYRRWGIIHVCRALMRWIISL